MSSALFSNVKWIHSPQGTMATSTFHTDIHLNHNNRYEHTVTTLYENFPNKQYSKDSCFAP